MIVGEAIDALRAADAQLAKRLSDCEAGLAWAQHRLVEQDKTLIQLTARLDTLVAILAATKGVT
jgi:hypothetical protein